MYIFKPHSAQKTKISEHYSNRIFRMHFRQFSFFHIYYIVNMLTKQCVHSHFYFMIITVIQSVIIIIIGIIFYFKVFFQMFDLLVGSDARVLHFVSFNNLQFLAFFFFFFFCFCIFILFGLCALFYYTIFFFFSKMSYR